MADAHLSPERLRAGADFLSAMRKLGLNPEGLFWAWDSSINEITLVLITSFYDQVGPLEVNKLLFRAYNLAITPQSISPFIIRLQSPQDDVTQFVRDFMKSIGQHSFELRRDDYPDDVATWRFDQITPAGETLSVNHIGIAGTSLSAFGGSLYTWREAASPGERAGQWRRITRRVEALAA